MPEHENDGFYWGRATAAWAGAGLDWITLHDSTTRSCSLSPEERDPAERLNAYLSRRQRRRDA
jgi:hypothetical protein